VAPLTPAHDGQRLGLGLLERRCACGSADVTDGVPALDHRQLASHIVDERDIDRAPRLRWLRRQLDQTPVARGTSEPQHQLLDPEMSRIGGLCQRVALQEYS
jgi:hypothetical protein